jgi:hypothetical protein
MKAVGFQYFAFSKTGFLKLDIVILVVVTLSDEESLRQSLHHYVAVLCFPYFLQVSQELHECITTRESCMLLFQTFPNP